MSRNIYAKLKWALCVVDRVSVRIINSGWIFKQWRVSAYCAL